MFDDTQEQLEKLESLLKSCYISEQEYNTRKNEILGTAQPSTPSYSNDYNSYNNYNNSMIENQIQKEKDELKKYLDLELQALENEEQELRRAEQQYMQQESQPQRIQYSMNIDIDDDYNDNIPVLNDNFSSSITNDSYNYNNSNNYSNSNNYNSNNNNNYNNNNHNSYNNNKTNNNKQYSYVKSAKPSPKEHSKPTPQPSNAPTFASAVFGSNTSKPTPQPSNAPTFASAVFGSNTSKPSTPTPTFASAVFGSPQPNNNNKGKTQAIASTTVTHKNKDYKFESLSGSSSVIHVDLSNWSKEKDNYGRPDDPSPSLKTTWKQEQLQLATQVIKKNANKINMTNLKYIGGVDISFAKNNKIDACACLVVLEYPSQKVVYESYKMVKLVQPYIAGFLAFREIPHLVPLWNDLKRIAPHFTPDVIVVDGNGINHMRGLGAACHLGVVVDCPTIGVAKTLLVCHGITPEGVDSDLADSDGDPVEMRSSTTNELMGFAMKNDLDESIYISPGHKMEAQLALDIVLNTLEGAPIPEPTHQADSLSRLFLNKYYSKF